MKNLSCLHPLMATNQLAALQQEQLLQIRALLVREQQTLAARNATPAKRLRSPPLPSTSPHLPANSEKRQDCSSQRGSKLPQRLCGFLCFFCRHLSSVFNIRNGSEPLGFF